MKPDWKDAPPEADWLAQDRDGEWCFHSPKPVPNKFMGYWDHKKVARWWETVSQGEPNPNWMNTLEARPK